MRIHRTARSWPAAGFAVSLLLVGGCGLSQSTVGVGQPAKPTASATRVATAIATPATGAVTVIATPAIGAVTLHLGQTHAGVADAVLVRVANNLPSAILVEDHQSECTMVTLERQEGGEWLAVAPCQLETPTRLLSIPSGTAQTVTLRPEGGSQSQVWQAGTYRFTLHYTAGTEGIAYSQTFAIA